MITLERLVALRSDKALLQRLFNVVKHSGALISTNPDEMIRGIKIGEASAIADAKSTAEASWLALYEETRRPYIDFLTLLDKSGIVRCRPHLHEQLKRLLK